MNIRISYLFQIHEFKFVSFSLKTIESSKFEANQVR